MKLTIGGIPDAVGDMSSANPYMRMMDPRGSTPHPLHDLLEQEKRQQQLSKEHGEVDGRSATALLSDQDFEKLRADVVNDPCKCLQCLQSAS